MDTNALKKHAIEIREHALKMFLDKNLNIDNIDKVYKMLEVAEHVLELTEQTANDQHATHTTMQKIKHKIKDIEDYFCEFETTKDNDFLQMIIDIISHVEKYMKLAVSEGLDITNEKQLLYDYKEKINSL